MARLLEPFAPPAMTAEERRTYDQAQADIVLERHRRGVPFGALACVLVSTVGSIGLPQHAAWTVRIGGAVAALVAVASVPLSRTAWVRSRPNVLLFFASLVVAAAAALIAAHTGGFESIATAGVTLLWIFGAIITPISPRQALVDAAGQLGIATIVILALAPHRGSFGMFGALNGCGVALLYAGFSCASALRFMHSSYSGDSTTRTARSSASTRSWSGASRSRSPRSGGTPATSTS
jgi:hypothetical protein